MTSSITFFSRSSNWPRYMVPATRLPTSSISRRLLSSGSGTSPSMMRCASPSTIAVLPTPGSPIRAGLFLVRRLRIWITRSISAWRPIDRVELVFLGRGGHVIAQLIHERRLGFFLLLFLGLRLVLQDVARSLRADTIQVDAQPAQHVDGNAFAFTHQAKQQMFRADIVVAHQTGLIHCQLDDALGARRQRGLAKRRAFATTHRAFYGTNNLHRFDAQLAQHLDGDTVLFPHQPQQQMFRPDVVMVQTERLFLRQRQDPTCALRKTVKFVRHTSFLEYIHWPDISRHVHSSIHPYANAVIAVPLCMGHA